MTTLEQIREFLSDPARWIKGQYHIARPDTEGPISHLNCEAACLLGSVFLFAPAHDPRWRKTIRHLRDVVRDNTIYYSVVDFNDHPDTTHQDILDLLDKAIEREKNER